MLDLFNVSTLRRSEMNWVTPSGRHPEALPYDPHHEATRLSDAAHLIDSSVHCTASHWMRKRQIVLQLDPHYQSVMLK